MTSQHLSGPTVPRKELPHNIEAEQGLLGAILINNEALKFVSDFLEPDHFFEPIHSLIYQVATDLIRAGKLATPVTMKTFMPPGNIGGLTPNQYLARLAAEATTVINAVDFGRLIYDLADRRAIVSVGDMLLQSGAHDPAKLAGEGIDILDSIVAKRSDAGSPTLDMPQAMARAVDAAAGAYQRDGKISGLTWGLADLDYKTLGMQPEELVILAGRPGMGKTALAISAVLRTAEAGNKVLFDSLEAGDISLSQRMIAEIVFDRRPIPYWVLRSGRFSESDFELISDAAKRIAELPIRIEQRAGLTLAQIAARARQMKRKNGLDLLVVDHIHIVRPSSRYAGNRVNEIGEVTSGLKALAKDLGIAVLALCQLSRQVEGRDSKKPNMGDLRGSGEIEQDADTIIMLYRESYYLERAKPSEADAHKFGEWLVAMEKVQNKLEAIIEKQRNGPIGAVELFCSIPHNVVRNASRADNLPDQRQGALI